MKRTITLVTLIMVTMTWAQEITTVMETQPVDPLPIIKTPYQPKVQIAILLDTSNSMDGLIDQAKTQLWSIVNEFIFAKQQRKTPEVQVALYEYGNSNLSQKHGYIRRVLPLTTDLDEVSQALFGLTTNGGSEYCGWVIQEAVQDLAWDQNPQTLKTVFIAGNEPFTQGNVDYRTSCKAAIASGILINTIHCGDEAKGRQGQWHLGAQLADGRYLNINQDQAIAYIEAPQDQEIVALNVKLNDTYLAYGVDGLNRKQLQLKQDTNAFALNSEALMQRSVAKASSNYRNSSWDLIDALKDNEVKLETLREEQLPEALKKLSPEERKKHIETKAQKRKEIQDKIQSLNIARQNYLTEERKKEAGQDSTLGDAIIQVVREQAEAKGYTFEKNTTKPGTKTD